MALPYPNIYFPGLNNTQFDKFTPLEDFFLHFIRLRELEMFDPEKHKLGGTWELPSDN